MIKKPRSRSSIGFDIGSEERLRRAQDLLGQSIVFEQAPPKEARIVIVGESDKCAKYLRDGKRVVFWPESETGTLKLLWDVGDAIGRSDANMPT